MAIPHIWIPIEGFVVKYWPSSVFRSPFYVFASKCTAIRKPQNWTKINQTSFRVVLAFDPITLETIIDVKLYVVLFSLSARCSRDLNTWNLKTRAIQKPTFFYLFFLFSIRPPPGLLPVLGPLMRYLTYDPSGIRSTVRRCRIYWMKNWRLSEPSHHGWINRPCISRVIERPLVFKFWTKLSKNFVRLLNSRPNIQQPDTILDYSGILIPTVSLFCWTKKLL